VEGFADPGFERVRDVFAENFAAGREVGARCCVYAGGVPVVDLWDGEAIPGGAAYSDRTLQMVASATKGALAIVAHRLVERGALDLDAPVTDYWPEFGARDVRVRWLLTHQAGLPAVHRAFTVEEIAGWDVPVAALAAETPAWPPGTRHGYHAITFGWLVGEVVRRITGRSAGTVFAEEVAGPLGLDLHIGLPESEHGRVAPLIPAPPAAEPDALTLRLLDPGSLTHWAFIMPSGLFGLLNDPDLWVAELPAGNGMGTAHALARMYAAVIGEVDGVRLLDPDTVAAAAAEQVRGADDILGFESAFGLGFQRPSPFRPMAGGACFGHYGLGGSVGFADPERGFTFGYTANRMAPGTPADERTVPLIGAVVASL
jgi:CubicO group peptidase (beta-lactamase class C family)